MLELLFGKWLRTSRLSKGWKSQPVIPVSSMYVPIWEEKSFGRYVFCTNLNKSKTFYNA